jgi:hypothetical protein
VLSLAGQENERRMDRLSFLEGDVDLSTIIPPRTRRRDPGDERAARIDYYGMSCELEDRRPRAR